MNDSNPLQTPNRLLVADRDSGVRDSVRRAAEQLGYLVAQAATESELRAEAARITPTVIVLDPEGLDTSAVEIFSWLAHQRSKAVIVIAAGANAGAAAAAQELGLAYGLNASVALTKPLSPDAIDAALAPQVMRAHPVTAAELRRAVDRAQLCVHYQPKLGATAHGWKVTGIEALLRWDHPDHGLIYPDQFIGIAEQHGLIAGLTDYVLQAGIEQLAAWNRAGLNLNLSVNLSPKLVTDRDFPERLDEFLAARGVAPEQLTVEITEIAGLVDPGPTLDILSRLRQKRIGLSLDDFGTGYSPLTQLYKLPFSEIKIDRSIGMELPQAPAVRTIVRALIDLGHSLGVKVCCEGVESAEALQFLQDAGCDHAQGFHIARPMPQAELGQWQVAANPWRESTLRRAG